MYQLEKGEAMKDLTERLERLEADNNRLKRLAIIAMVGIAAVLLMGQGRSSKVIEAEKFVLRDASGRIMADLATRGGSAFLTIYGENAKVRTLLGPGVLSIHDTEENLRNTILLLGSLVHYDMQGKPRVQLNLTPDGSARFELRDKNGNTRAILGYAELEKVRAGTVEQRPESSLVLFDRDGTVHWKAP